MSSPKYRLEKLLQKLKRVRRIDESAVINIIATVRQIIESTKSQSEFPILTLYCNWSLHTQISVSLTALRCLESITLKILQISAATVTPEELIEFLSNQLFETARLRVEITELFKSNGLTEFIFSVDRNWQVFAALLYSALVGKRLQYPLGVELSVAPGDSDSLKKAKKIHDRLSIAVDGNQRKMHRAAWISLAIDPWDERPEDAREPVFHSNVETFDNVTFVFRINDLTPLPEADDYSLIVGQ